MSVIKSNLVNAEIAVGDHPLINWQAVAEEKGRYLDAPKDMFIKLRIDDGDIFYARMTTGTCALAQSCGREKFSFFAIGRDTARVGGFLNGSPVIFRFRSGELPRRLDKALTAMSKNYKLGWDEFNVKTYNEYTLRPPSKAQGLENKKKINAKYRAEVKAKTRAVPPSTRKVSKHSTYVPAFVGRGILHAS